MTLVFPLQTLAKSDSNAFWENQSNKRIEFAGEILFFDKHGELLKIKSEENFTVVFWCENDGGIQFRPSLKLSIAKTKFKRGLKAITEIQNITCFALINKTNDKTERPESNVSKDIVVQGDYNNDGVVDCFLWTYYDDAENCSGKPVNNLGIMLQNGRKSIPLRCCGP